MILGNPTLENLKMCYDLAKQEVSLSHGNMAVRLPLEYYPSYGLPLTDRYSDFTLVTEYETDDKTPEPDEEELLANHVGLIDEAKPTMSPGKPKKPTRQIETRHQRTARNRHTHFHRPYPSFTVHR